ncbi:MAG: D-alanine--D-alanine ligase [Sporomusaceae bacterium]|nr:D-alanine--D-alanine ligase [Sporomusaceae bacterium]
MKKIRVGILCGGRSTEHEVSLQSANSILAALDKNKYDITLIGIDKTGGWYLYDAAQFLLNSDDPARIALRQPENEVVFISGEERRHLFCKDDPALSAKLDVVFPVLHGAYGEDGTVQGLLKLADIPFVGAGVLGSAIGMDKDVAKRLLRDAAIPIAKFLVLHSWERQSLTFAEASRQLGLPLFIKPANAGSSVGVNKVRNAEDFDRALAEAFNFDNKVLIEEFVAGREVECSVLGNQQPIASRVGEIIAQDEFYSYTAKYIEETGAVLAIPAELPPDVETRIRDLAVRAYRVLCCEGMARVDFFFTADNRVLINEINTIPGFTKISMYPKLWEISGIAYSELLDRLIELALERHRQERQLKTSHDN